MPKSLIACLLTLSSAMPHLTAQGWVDATPALPGPQAQSAGMCYDPVHAVTWLFRIVSQQSLRVHSWDGFTWTDHGSAAVGPMSSSHTPKAFWHAGLQKVVVAAWENGWQLWSWDGSSWAHLGNAVGSTLRLIAYDTARQELCMRTLNGGFFVWDGQTVTQPQPPVQPTQVTSNTESMFYDSVAQRVVLVLEGTAQTEYWEWTGTNWVQKYPNPRYSSLGAVAEAPARGMHVAQTFWDSSIQPRTFSIANGTYTELFLTNWPARRNGHLMVYDSGRDRFVMHGGQSDAGYLTDTWELELGPDAAYSTFGAGCPGIAGTPTLAPQAGTLPTVNSQFTLQVTGLPWSGPTFMWLGFSNQQFGSIPLPVNLGALGAPLCDVLISPDLLYATPNVIGTSIWTLPIPNVPGWTFYNQAIGFDSTANDLGLVFSNAGEAVVGQ